MTADVRDAVAVTGMNATDNPAPGVAVARALRLSPQFCGRVIGLGYDPLDPGFYAEGVVDGGGLLPYPSSGSDVLMDRLRALKAEFGFRALLPTLDSELRGLIALAPQLEQEGIGTFVPTLDALERVSKPQLGRLTASADLRVPESDTATTPEMLAKAVARLGLPVVVKGLYYGAHVVYSEADALGAFRFFEATWGLPVVVQEFVTGDEYNVCALGDGAGGLVGAVAMRKMVLTDKGKGWAGVTVANPRLLALAESVVGTLRWRGPLELEAIADDRGMGDSSVHVIEINPRFPAWAYLTAAAGQNLPFVCAQMALGHPSPGRLPPYVSGRMFVRISLDQIADLSTFAQLSATGRLSGPPL